MSREQLRIGYIPLADAAALIVAVDKGFTAAEGLDVELVSEVSWSNVRDKTHGASSGDGVASALQAPCQPAAREQSAGKSIR